MNAPEVVVAGEALVDLAPRAGALLPLPGGSPYNVAVGLGRLGTRTTFLGRLSTDGFGSLLSTRLEEAGVSLTATSTTDAPTTLAVVHLDDQSRASYGFYLEGTSAATLDQDALPDLADATALHLSLGAITFDTRPAGAAFTALIEREAGRRTISLDPNVRPNMIRDLSAYAQRLSGIVARCDLVKVSDEDLGLLYPHVSAEEVAGRWAASGPAVVVVTRGPGGALGLTPSGDEVDVPGEDVDLVDTVGAGDAFTSGLLDALGREACLARPALRTIETDTLRGAMQAAVHVAAVTCTRAGADPPRREQLVRGA